MRKRMEGAGYTAENSRYDGDHAFSYDREALIRMLDEAMGNGR